MKLYEIPPAYRSWEERVEEADGDWRKSYATPHVATIAGQPGLLSSGAKAHYAYEPLTNVCEPLACCHGRLVCA